MIDITSASSTATVCESMALYGAAPERGERDSRIIWDEDDATGAMSEAIRIIVGGITVDGTQIADEREPLMWGLVNMLHSQVQRLDRAVDRIVPEMKELQTAQDGSEVKAHELELLVDRAQNLGDRRDAFEKMRDLAADAYRAETGDTWRPRSGSHVSKTGALTSAAIDARDFVRARKDRETRAHLPKAPWSRSPAARSSAMRTRCGARSTGAREARRHGLVHGGGPGVEKVAASWAEARGVDQVVCRPDWNAHGKAAPFRRNDDLLNLMPKGVIAFPARASPATSSTRHGSSAFPCSRSPLDAAPLPPGAGRRCGGDRPHTFFAVPPLAHRGAALRAGAARARFPDADNSRARPRLGAARHRRTGDLRTARRLRRHRTPPCFIVMHPSVAGERLRRAPASAALPAVMPTPMLPPVPMQATAPPAARFARLPAAPPAPPIVVATSHRRACTVDDEVTSAPPASALKGTCETNRQCLERQRVHRPRLPLREHVIVTPLFFGTCATAIVR